MNGRGAFAAANAPLVQAPETAVCSQTNSGLDTASLGELSLGGTAGAAAIRLPMVRTLVFRWRSDTTWFAGSLLACGLMLAQPALAGELLRAYDAALEHDAIYQQARQEFEVALPSVTRARANLFPQVSLSASRNETRQDIRKSDNSLYTEGVTHYESDSLGMNVSQAVVSIAAWRNLQKSRHVVAAAQAEVDQAVELGLRLVDALFELLKAKSRWHLVQAEHDASVQQLHRARALQHKGLGSRVDVIEAEAALASVQAALEKSRFQVAINGQALATICGINRIMAERVLPEVPIVAPAEADLRQWVADALTSNNALRAQTAVVDGALSELDVRRAARFPTIDLSASLTLEDSGGATFGGGGRESSATSIALSLNLPLFQGGASSALIRQAASAYEAEQAKRDQVQRNLAFETNAAFLELRGTVRSVDALKLAVDAAGRVLAAQEERFERGAASTADILEAQMRFYRTRRELEEAKISFVIGQFKVSALRGKLDRDRFKEIDGWIG